MASKRVAGCSNLLVIQSTGNCGRLAFNLGKLIDEDPYFLDPVPPEEWCSRRVRRKAADTGTGVRRLYDRKAAFSPELRKVGIPVFRRDIVRWTVPMR